MRPAVLNQPETIGDRLRRGVLRQALGFEPGPLAVAAHRGELFGEPFSRYVRSLTLEPTAWSRGEIELFVAFIGRLAGCGFCERTHRPLAERRLGAGVVARALDDWRTADLPPRLAAGLHLVEQLVSDPEGASVAQVQALADAGASEHAVEEIVRLCFAWTVVARLAEAFDFAVPEPGQARRAARLGDGIATFVVR